jgi:mannose-1-phosphate guanylyltransferase
MWRDGHHAWSAGTFAFRPEVFLESCDTHLPEVARPVVEASRRHGRRDHDAAMKRAYRRIPGISVDYGVMEKAARQQVFVAEVEWDDLGSWDAVARHRRADPSGNRVRGAVTVVESEDCVVDAGEGHVALLGVKDLIVVRTEDAVLVARRGRGEDVREMVARLEAEGRGKLVE